LENCPFGIRIVSLLHIPKGDENWLRQIPVRSGCLAAEKAPCHSKTRLIGTKAMIRLVLFIASLPVFQ
jgi:hypothetical protein